MMALQDYFNFKMSGQLRKYHALRLEQLEETQAAHDRLNRARVALDGKYVKDLDEKDPLRVEWEAASDVLHGKNRISERYKSKMEPLWKKAPEDQRKQYDAAWKRFWLSDENAQPACGKPDPISPCGNYKLVITSHPTGPSSWSYTKAKVFVKDGEGWKQVQEVARNYHDFWFHFMTHSNGKDYLWCGEDYQGFTCIELPSGKMRSHRPKAAEKGFGFCWTDMDPSPDGKILAVFGCYWACPYETKFYDFSDPDIWPVVEIGGIDSTNVEGWTEDGQEFVGSEHHLIRKSDGADLNVLWEKEEITDLEYEQASDDKEAASWEGVEVRWKRPTGRQMYREGVRWYDHQQKNDVDLTDITARLARYWEMMTDEERASMTPVHL